MRGYDVVRKLSDGSAAEVFLAREQSSKGFVILEVIRPELTTDMEIYGRFLDEAKERQQLSHPNLIRRRSTSCAPDGRLFVITEPIPPEHLGSWLAAHGPMQPDEVVRLVLPICDAVEYLHSRGMVHGHLRPSNVFLEGSPPHFVPKLFDTGLALLRPQRSIPTRSVLVEPDYLAPERIRGHRAIPQSDVYGLGILMYEALTGRPPFAAPDPNAVRTNQLTAPPPPLPASCGRIAPIILRCLAKDPSQRYRSAAELRHALAHHADATPTPTTSPRNAVGSTTTSTSKPSRTQPSTAGGSRPQPPEPAPAGDQPIVVGELVSEVLGSYELGELIGKGGMGCVYSAQHVKLGRKVALKVLRPELSSDPTQLQRFIQEAQAVNRISHEHIVEIHDFVEEPKEAGGRVYCVMELLTGESLKQAMKRAPLTIGRAVRIVRQVCDALQAAHDVGVVHRDVKPDNIFLTQRGGQDDFVKVLDFGVAKLWAATGESNPGATQAGLVVGTPSYMAPEQAMGEGIDHRADVYALTTVLYALLAGKPPFEGSSIGPVLTKLLTQPPPPLPERSASGEPIPSALRAIIQNGLAKKPNQRIASMTQLSELLAPFEAASATPPPLPTHHRAFSGRRRAIALGAAVGVLLAVGAGAALWARAQPPVAAAEPEIPAAHAEKPARSGQPQPQKAAKRR